MHYSIYPLSKVRVNYRPRDKGTNMVRLFFIFINMLFNFINIIRIRYNKPNELFFDNTHSRPHCMQGFKVAPNVFVMM